MIPKARKVRLKPKERMALEVRCRTPTIPQRDARRARIVLLAAAGHSSRSIAAAVGVRPNVASLWRNRFADQGLGGLKDKPRPGKKPIFTPTRASWLNQVEIWFSILQGKSLTGASFTAVKQLRNHIDAFIHAYNENATPFVWTKTKVHQRRVKGRRISQL